MGWPYKVKFQHPLLPPLVEVEKYFALSQEARWYSNFGPCCDLLEKRLMQLVGRGSHCVPVSSGTMALIVALQALARTDDDRIEVLVPSYTFIASVSAIACCGLRPVFIDVDPRHWSPSDPAVRQALDERGSRVAAVMACTTFGTPPPVSVSAAWESACREAGVPLIVDSAAGFGAIDEDGEVLGCLGDAQVFSFHATKPFAIGEGGAVFTRDADAAERIRTIANFGLREKRPSLHPGINGKMSELHAAVALAVLDRFDEVLSERRRLAASITTAAARHGFEVQDGHSGSPYQFVPVLATDGDARASVLKEAVSRSIELRTYHEPLHHAACFAGVARVGALEVTQDLSSRTLSLPLATDMAPSGVEAVGSLLAHCAPTLQETK